MNDCFDLDDQPLLDDEVESVSAVELDLPVLDRELPLAFETQAPEGGAREPSTARMPTRANQAHAIDGPQCMPRSRSLNNPQTFPPSRLV